MRALIGLVACVALAACGNAADAPPSGSATTPVTTAVAEPAPGLPSPTATVTHGNEHPSDYGQPPPFRVRYDHTELQLWPWTYCYEKSCVDGADPAPPSIGSPDEIYVHVPVESMTSLTATQVEDGDHCAGRKIDAELERLGEGWWRVRPRGPAGSYEVSLFASGGGDMVASLRWDTRSDTPLPAPEASIAVVADHDGRPDSYGVELGVSNLAATPHTIEASVEVTTEQGRSVTIDIPASTDACVGEGALWLVAPAAEGRRASALGGDRFSYRVSLTLDGTTHTATATFPDDLIDGLEPHVALRFEPSLS